MFILAWVSAPRQPKGVTHVNGYHVTAIFIICSTILIAITLIGYYMTKENVVNAFKDSLK